MGKILLFHVNIFKAEQIRSLCQKLNHQVIQVPAGEDGSTLGFLAGIPGIKNNKETSLVGITNEMMVFSGIDSDALDVFLAEYKEAGIAPIPRKAILTPSNVKWSGVKLFREISEHI